MKLFYRALAVSIKYTLKAAVLPFVALLLCIAILLLAQPQEVHLPRLAIGVRCLDTHSLVSVLTTAVLSSPELEEFAQVHMLSPDEQRDGLAAIITLPEGFTASILSGENLSPTVELGSTGIATVYIRELCTAVERYLASAQAGIYATLNAAEQLPPEQYDKVLTEINIKYATLFLNRKAMLSQDFQSYDSFYVMRCAVSVLLFLLCGALGGAVPPLLTAARSMGSVKWSTFTLFAGGSMGVVLFCIPVTLLCLVAAFGSQVLQQPLAVFLLAALLSAVSIFFFSVTGGSGTAAIILSGFTLITALLSGLIIPGEILPEAMTRLAPLLPIYHVRELISMLSGGYAGGMTGAVVQIALWLTAAALLWVREVRRR